jgi:multidrug efflux pump subunit AcrA (membrane-fusion protein)
MRYTKIKIGTAVVAGIAALALAGCGSTSGTTASQSSSPGSPAAAATRSVSYTAAQQTFINDLSSQYNLGGGTASDNANAVELGNYVCSGFQSGESVSSVDSAVQQVQTPSISASEAAGIVSLAGQDLCPQTAQAKAAAAAVKAAAAKAAAAKAAAAQAAAAKAAAARAARIAAENTPISSDQWGRVLRNPDNYVGDIYTISGTVSEYNINSNTFASNANAALVATDANGNSFVVEADSSLLGNVQPGQTFSAKVTVEGVDQSQNTVSGGTGEIPDFLASTFTVTG